MRIKCYKCHMSIPLDRDFIYEALDYIEEEKLSHYDVRCPKCRTTNRVSKKQLRRAVPRGKREE
jgi:Zn finger protein HypA/HybF involved in hydrogenase expression